MTTGSNTDIQQLKEFIKDGFNQLDRKIDDKFNQLDRKIDTVKSELKQEISEVKSELKQEISEVKSELKQEMSEIKGDIRTIEARQKNVETAIQKIPEITEKFGELKNWRRCLEASQSKALETSKMFAFIIIAAVAGWFAKTGKM